MSDFRHQLYKVSAPYMICQPTVDGGALYDYGVCGVLEDYLYESMDKGEFSASFNYLDFACDGAVVQGCMTITIMQYDFIPEVFTFLYERELSTCASI
jgi:hypothetical protein